MLNDIASFQTGFIVAFLTAVFFFFLTRLSPQSRLTFANGSNVSLSYVTLIKIIVLFTCTYRKYIDINFIFIEKYCSLHLTEISKTCAFYFPDKEGCLADKWEERGKPLFLSTRLHSVASYLLGKEISCFYHEHREPLSAW